MEAKITITIDNKSCEAIDGEYILNIARRNDIFIPAICYLTRCSPTLACRLCLVKVGDKNVYACNAKAKDGMVVELNTEDIHQERSSIMQVYDINHPLQCGVCDQAGECELQNYTLYENINEQKYAINSKPQEVKKWGEFLKYDPFLCIVCERCVTVCKDMVGESALSTIPRGTEPLNKDLKEEVPKDAYAMWNKLNKSIIGSVYDDDGSCSDCGECISVCPVGALVNSDFQYKSNAWELTKIPSTCSHCSSGCSLYYEVKHKEVLDNNKEIYRVTNEFHYESLCGAGRFGFDYENKNVTKDSSIFDKSIAEFKKADTIIFNSMITNEEAYILQELKLKYKYKLINKDAFRFKKFMSLYSKITGNNLYSATTKNISQSNFVISVGSMLRYDAPTMKYAFNNAIKMNKGAGLYFHCAEDKLITSIGKNVETIEHKANREEYIIYLLIELFCDKEMLPEDIKSNLASLGDKIFEELNIGEDFKARVEKLLLKKDKFSLIVGEDIISHHNYENLAKLIGIFESTSKFDVMILPTNTNTLGVSLICDLDEKSGEYSIGYNENGNFILSSLGDGDIDMPALNQSEGTFVNRDKRVVSINAALPYGGYELNDIANALGINSKQVVDYTKKLPNSAGFLQIDFDDIEDSMLDNGIASRGYELKKMSLKKCDTQINLPKVENLTNILAYRCNPITQFNYFTNKTSQLSSVAKATVSLEFIEKHSFSVSDKIEISNKNGKILLGFEIDENLQNSDMLLIPTFDKNLDTKVLFEDIRFCEVSVKKV